MSQLAFSLDARITSRARAAGNYDLVGSGTPLCHVSTLADTTAFVYTTANRPKRHEKSGDATQTSKQVQAETKRHVPVEGQVSLENQVSRENQVSHASQVSLENQVSLSDQVPLSDQVLDHQGLSDHQGLPDHQRLPDHQGLLESTLEARATEHGGSDSSEESESGVEALCVTPNAAQRSSVERASGARLTIVSLGRAVLDRPHYRSGDLPYCAGYCALREQDGVRLLMEVLDDGGETPVFRLTQMDANNVPQISITGLTHGRVVAEMRRRELGGERHRTFLSEALFGFTYANVLKELNFIVGSATEDRKSVMDRRRIVVQHKQLAKMEERYRKFLISKQYFSRKRRSSTASPSAKRRRLTDGLEDEDSGSSLNVGDELVHGIGGLGELLGAATTTINIPHYLWKRSVNFARPEQVNRWADYFRRALTPSVDLSTNHNEFAR